MKSHDKRTVVNQMIVLYALGRSSRSSGDPRLTLRHIRYCCYATSGFSCGRRCGSLKFKIRTWRIQRGIQLDKCSPCPCFVLIASLRGIYHLQHRYKLHRVCKKPQDVALLYWDYFNSILDGGWPESSSNYTGTPKLCSKLCQLNANSIFTLSLTYFDPASMYHSSSTFSYLQYNNSSASQQLPLF